MRYYELLYIVNPNIEDDKTSIIIDEIGKEVEKYKVSIINHNIWGKKRLAYPIKNNKYGIYILLQFGTDKFDFLKEFERYLILSKSVIRHQIVKLDAEPEKVENIEPEVDESKLAKSDSFVIPEVPVTSDVNTEELQEVTEAENVDDIVEPEPEEPIVEKESKEEGE
jgi:small subunit ribosomal protein S6